MTARFGYVFEKVSLLMLAVAGTQRPVPMRPGWYDFPGRPGLERHGDGVSWTAVRSKRRSTDRRESPSGTV
ncbi:hypothetical protein ACNHUS_13210 [Actinomycetes bacterium M1A6_2h]